MAELDQARLDGLRRTLRARGSQLPPAILRLARAVAGETDDGLAHEDCVAVIPELVDAEMAGGSIMEKYGRVKHHLDICHDCSEQYAASLQLTLAKRAGEIPTRTAKKRPDLSFLPRPITLPEFVKQKAMAVLKAISPTELPDFSGLVDPFLKKAGLLDAGSVFLGEKLTFQRSTLGALGLGAGELTTPVATLAVAYVATGKLVESLSPDEVDALAAQNALGQRAEELALLAARDLNVKSATAKEVAAQFAAVVGADPGTLRALIEREKP